MAGMAAFVDSASVSQHVNSVPKYRARTPSQLTLTLAEIAALAGYEYIIIDLDALDAARTPAIIRIPTARPVWAKKALDLGPPGLMIPNVECPAAAVAAVSYCYNPPRGVRGAACPVVRASAYGMDDYYLSRCEDGTLVICQVETATGIGEVEAIAPVDGVDVLQMGLYDLAENMGYLRDPEKAQVRAKMREAEKKVLQNSRAYLGGFAMPRDPTEQLKQRGYHMVSGAKDISLFRNAALEHVRRFMEYTPSVLNLS